jgi:hypothetical protein|tara:strand:- start:532 stop:1266 length:735 start_codon:yes stop_codon:yes gene_type:complete
MNNNMIQAHYNRPRCCTLCRQPNHNVRTCPQVNVLDKDHLDRFIRFLLDNDIFSKEEAIRYRFQNLYNRNIVELKCLAKKYNLRIETMDKRDMYRALKTIYIETALIGIDLLFLQRSVIYYSELYSTISFIQHAITNDLIQLPYELVSIPNIRFYVQEKHTTESWNPYECPICLEEVKTINTNVQFNCGHSTCFECFFKYIDTVKENILKADEAIEQCIPKCPLCRTTIHTLCGDIETLQRIDT